MTAVFILLLWIYIATTDNRLYVSITNEMEFDISGFALIIDDQYCSTSLLPRGESVQCTLHSSGNNSIDARGRMNNEAFTLRNIGKARSGRSHRNLVVLKPGNTHEFVTRQVIL